MNLYLKHYSIPPLVILKNAGYKHRKKENDFIREIHSGRFHIKYSDIFGQMLMHFDLYIENRHVVFELPITLGKEKGRILGINKFFKKELKKDELIYSKRYLRDKQKYATKNFKTK